MITARQEFSQVLVERVISPTEREVWWFNVIVGYGSEAKITLRLCRYDHQARKTPRHKYRFGESGEEYDHQTRRYGRSADDVPMPEDVEHAAIDFAASLIRIVR